MPQPLEHPDKTSCMFCLRLVYLVGLGLVITSPASLLAWFLATAEH